MLPNSDIFTAEGNYKLDGKRIASKFILETKKHEHDVRFISSKLSKESLKGAHESLLPVMGYRQPPYNLPDGTQVSQIVIELPQGLNQSSLSHLLGTEQPLALMDRLELCAKLARATDAVHSIDLVHGSIRTRTILVLSAPGAPLRSASLHLQDWTYIREVDGTTSLSGQMDWPKRIYQHPERQGRYATSEYKPRHDIYSLGVRILEVLLWKPFVVTDGTHQLKVCDLFEKYGFARDEQEGGLPSKYRGDSAKMTSLAWVTQTVWRDMAESEVAYVDLKRLVMRCLNGEFATARDVTIDLERMIAVRKR